MSAAIDRDRIRERGRQRRAKKTKVVKRKKQPVLTPAGAAVEYALRVMDKKITSCHLMRKQAWRWSDQLSKGAHFRPEMVEDFYEWCASTLKFNNGPKAGEPFVLAPYQLWVVAMMLATYKSPESNETLYDELYWLTGKSSTKTTLTGAVLLAHMDMPQLAKPGTLLPVI